MVGAYGRSILDTWPKVEYRALCRDDGLDIVGRLKAEGKTTEKVSDTHMNNGAAGVDGGLASKSVGSGGEVLSEAADSTSITVGLRATCN